MALTPRIISGTNPEAHGSAPPEPGMPMHTLYLGSEGGTGFRTRDFDTIRSAITLEFESFTMVSARGVYRGKPLPSLIIKIGTVDSDAVRRVAHKLGRLFAQEAVGLECAGVYCRIAMD